VSTVRPRLIAQRSAWTTGLGTTLAFGNWGALPWMIGAWIEGAGFTAEQAGFLAATELTVMSISMFALAPIIPRIDRRGLVLMALPVILAAQVASAYIYEYRLLLVLRVLSGMAFGAIFSTGTAEGAESREPDRAFAFATIVAMCCGVLKTPMLGYAKELFGLRGVFLSLTVYYLAIGTPLIVLLWLGVPGRRAGMVRSESRPLAPLRWGPTIGMLLVMAGFSIATGGVFAFVERVAHSIGISSSLLGRGFSGAALIGTLGGLSAERLGIKLGRALPTLAGMGALGLLSWCVMNSSHQANFWLSYVVWVVIHWFTYAYIMGLSAMVDSSGRIATLTSSTYILTGAAGAALAGVFTQRFGVASYGWMAFATCLFAATVAAGMLGWPGHLGLRANTAGREAS